MPEVGFSYELTIAGSKFDRFGDVRITQTANGFGTSGVCTSEFNVTVTAEEYGRNTVPPNAAVTFGRVDSPIRFAPTFYIASRSKRGGSVTFKCYDRMMFTDQEFIPQNISFSNGYAESTDIVADIASQCGFEHWSSVIDLIPSFKISEEYVSGKTCRGLLEAISAAWCGYFKVNNDDILRFIPFGMVECAGSQALHHTTVIEKSVKGPIEQVIMTDGEKEYISGNENADIFGTLKISTEFASQELASFIMGRLKGYVYQAWECKKAVIDYGLGHAEIDAEIDFADGMTRIANNMVKYPSPWGIVISCGRNDVIENEFDYTGALSRDIARRIADGEKLGNKTMLTRYQGLVHIGAEKKEEDGSVVQNRYGYAPATADGVVEFDGAMVSNVVFDSAELVDDKTAVITYPGDVKYKFTMERNGNKITAKKERVKEENSDG
ncbi:MAG: hypothetical protein J6C96_05630 [Oscillospiraceae bacterium]|nr:hypothetical protein [Oscillospiraceae bacterium]